MEEGKPDDVINHPQKERTKAFLEHFLPTYIPSLQGQMMYNKLNVLKDKGV